MLVAGAYISAVCDNRHWQYGVLQKKSISAFTFMYVAVVVFTALLIVFSRLSDDTRASRPAMCKNKLLGAAAVVMAVGTAYDSADSMLSFSASC